MKAKDINTIEEMQHFVEGCLNDYEAGISDKEETLKYLKEYTFRVMELCVSMKLTAKQMPEMGKPKVIKTFDGIIAIASWNGIAWKVENVLTSFGDGAEEYWDNAIVEKWCDIPEN